MRLIVRDRQTRPMAAMVIVGFLIKMELKFFHVGWRGVGQVGYMHANYVNTMTRSCRRVMMITDVCIMFNIF